MRRLLPILLLLASAPAGARVLSYAPYTNRVAMPAVQHRLNRHFVLVEFTQAYGQAAQAVLYDSKGEEEPRVIYTSTIYAAAVREDGDQLAIFLQTDYNRATLSVDGGATWKSLVLPGFNALMAPWADIPETGGPYVRARGGALRVGTRAMPFVVNMNSRLYGVTRDGELKTLLSTPASLLGGSRDGSKFLARVGATTIVTVDTAGNVGFVGHAALLGVAEGWITPSGGAYIETVQFVDTLYYVDTGVTKTVSTTASFAVPSADYAGAWLVTRDAKSTTLAFHTPATGLTTQWTDASAPEVEAVYPGQSGKTVLIQVHRPRAALDQSLFKDPALAVWHIGDLPPAGYDELFMAETPSKGFIHVDPDAIESGEPFVFDSGLMSPSGIISPAPGPSPTPPPSAGGSDVVQEWGVVRASLAQRLVLPGAAHAPGAMGSFWKTDVTFYNPSDVIVHVAVRDSIDGRETTLALAPHEIRTVADVLQTLFGVDSGGGALFITPESGTAVNVTGRTYTESARGTLGYGINAIDVFTAFSPRFPATFAAALLGPNYRTNLVITDVSGRATDATVTAWSGPAASAVQSYSTPVLGQEQINRVGDALNVGDGNAALVVQPTRGEALVSAVAIDNQTNDATYFPPDIAASVVRMFAAVGHVDGANGTHFRTDIHVFNNSATAHQIYLQPTMWDGAPVAFQRFTLQPHEVRVFPDVLFTTFSRSGMARMRLWSGGSTTDPSIRATARTYTVDANGGTYGFLMPPLNSFQTGAVGDTLEILGTSPRKGFRTNLGLVDTTRCDACGVHSRARVDIIDKSGATLDSFETDLPAAGAMQIDDLFRARNLPESNDPVLIRVTVLNGMLGAYAAVIDNGTNDPAYFAANLASKG